MGTNQPPYSDLTLFANQTSQNQTRILSSSISSSPSSSTAVFENVHYIPHVSSLLQSPLPPSTPRSQQLIVGSQTLVQSSPQHFTRFPSAAVASTSTPMQMPLNVSPQRIRAVLPPAPRPTLTASISLPPIPVVRQIPPNGKTRDEFYKRKHYLLKKCIKSLVFVSFSCINVEAVSILHFAAFRKTLHCRMKWLGCITE